MNENNYSITPLPVLSNVSGVNSTKKKNSRKKRHKQKKRSTENPDLIEIDGNRFRDDKPKEDLDSQDNEHRIDFCA